MFATWILVADSCRARFFSMHSRNESLSELEDMVHDER
jgi:hypothetical protein